MDKKSELDKINGEIEEQLIREVEEGENKIEKKGYLSIRFWIMLGFMIFMLYRVLKPFFTWLRLE